MSTRLFALTERGDGVVSLCIATDREPYLGPEWVDAFANALTRLARTPAARAVVLTGGTRHFCAGADRDTLLAADSGDAVSGYAVRAAEALLALPLPVIAAAEGHAIGGGLLLALWCDAVVLAEDGLYGANFMALGMTPGMGATHVVPEAFGAVLGRDLLLSGRLLTGREIRAAACPLSHTVRARSQVLERAFAVAREFAEPPRKAVTQLKRMLSARRREQLERAVRAEQEAHAALFAQAATRAEIAVRYPNAPTEDVLS